MFESKKSFWTSLTVALLPCALLIPPHAAFSGDWTNHFWLIDYFAEYLWIHHRFPTSINTHQWIGMPLPIFYGFLLYRILALLSIVFSTAFAIRITLFAVFLFEFLNLKELFRRLGADVDEASFIACLMTWSIYPLTNLYNRFALPEFYATGLLVIGLFYFTLLFISESSSEKKRSGWSFSLVFALSAGSHPVTALFGAMFYSLAGIIFGLLVGWPSFFRSLKYLILPGFLTFIVLAPWIDAVFQFSSQLAISSHPYLAAYTNNLDQFLTRFYPIPFDSRMLRAGPDQVSSPYLDAQINLPLFILIMALTIRLKSKKVFPLVLSGIVFIFFSLLSLSSDVYKYFPTFFQLTQFMYRMISYQNLSLVLFLIIVFFLARHRGQLISRSWMAILVTWSLFCVLLKMNHGFVFWRISDSSLFYKSPAEFGELLKIPNSYYGTSAFEMPQLHPSIAGVSSSIHLAVRDGSSFGDVLPIHLQNKTEGWIATNILPFSWDVFKLDGQTLDSSRLGTVSDRPALVAVKVPEGDHELTLSFEPDLLWVLLNLISTFVLCFWILSAMVLSIMKRRS